MEQKISFLRSCNLASLLPGFQIEADRVRAAVSGYPDDEIPLEYSIGRLSVQGG
jgi:hypothetical protein